MNNVDDITSCNPDESWDLDRLAEFCKATLRRTATDAFRLGKALSLSRDKQKEDRNWLTWLKGIPMPKSTAYRYMDLAAKFTPTQIKNLTLSDAYRILAKVRAAHAPAVEPASDTSNNPDVSGGRPSASKAQLHAASPAIGQTPLKLDGPPLGNGNPSWAVGIPEDTRALQIVIQGCEGLANDLDAVLDRQQYEDWDEQQRGNALRQIEDLEGRLDRLKDVLQGTGVSEEKAATVIFKGQNDE